MAVENNFPKDSDERSKLEEEYTPGVLNMMDSDRPNNRLIGGLNFVGTIKAYRESGRKIRVKDKVLFAVADTTEMVMRFRAIQLGWRPEDVEEEIVRGREIYYKKHPEDKK